MAKVNTPKSVSLRSTTGVRRLSFGLVTVSVGTAPALDATARVTGNKVDPVTMTRVKQAWLNADGELCSPVTMYPCGDSFVSLAPGEVTELDGDGAVHLVGSLESLPAEWITNTYVAWPADSSQDGAYTALARYLQSSGRSLVGRTVDHGTTKVLAVRWSDVYGCVVTHVLAFHAQVRWTNVRTISEWLIGQPEPEPALQAMADAAFGSIPLGFEWESVTDDYGDRLAAAIAAKATMEVAA